MTSDQPVEQRPYSQPVYYSEFAGLQPVRKSLHLQHRFFGLFFFLFQTLLVSATEPVFRRNFFYLFFFLVPGLGTDTNELVGQN